MATTDEIRRRVELADAERSNRRLATAQLVGELAHRRTVLATELQEVDVKLGELITEAEDVMSLPELASFTDVPVDELTKWTVASKPKRGRRKRSSARPPKPGSSSDQHNPAVQEISSAQQATSQALAPAAAQ
ncbi:hypothetical protein C8D87_11633 [Lentzea atacamensis]|uniref:Uncharacterized protein n=1 Tax=Lentzea atacamensis TaxID=531938 RepID=A0ABX9DVS7_9PSEU|nr:hypothetical protein [Lentzea atacamensis]RAS58980.1 hypothetical protein C8D87_11633 [Lentzea atacamensis]